MTKFAIDSYIIWENDDLLVLNKPAGISSLDEHLNQNPSLFSLLKKKSETYRLCHRLDKFTSGCLIVSKNNEAYRHIAMQFENREIEKIYHAVLEGQHQFDNLAVDVPLIKKQNNTAFWMPGGKPSLTYFSTITNFKHYTLCACKPITGRFHQIRIHAKYLKAPLAADLVYGGKLPFLSAIMPRYKNRIVREENPMMARVALHAKDITFKDLNQKEINVIAEYPKDFSTFIKLLQKNDMR